ncbi:hypothetical protein C8R43DRAFT_1005334 [Mycena crocata]|nr:hypothetical protein C8R43DRAFT_1005334 [Mycena crocata]
MASKARKQVTYAHKRNRSKATKIVSASSPLHEIEDSDFYMSHSSPRVLKRARRSSNPEMFTSKKLKASIVTPAGSPSQYYETPYPSALTEEQKFKLNSSRGLPMHPDQFSPLPVARPITGSRKLKENRTRRIPKKDSASLDSPFNSRPGSACTSPQKPDNFALEHRLFKRTLSDKNYSPNIPQSASTANSPAHSPARLRRPSAPSPPRPGTWVSRFDFVSPANPFFLPSATNEIDFNRPPSSLSFYGDADAQLFDSPAPAYTLGSALADEEEDRERGLPGAMDVDFSWGLESAYLHDDVDMCADDDDKSSPAFGLAAFVPSGEEDHAFHGELKQMFDGLALGPKSYGLPSRARSLDSEAPASAVDDENPKPKGRDRRGTIRASDFDFPKAVNGLGLGLARRTRSGTVVGRTRSGTVVGPRSLTNDNDDFNACVESPQTGKDSIGEVENEDEDEELGGWAVAAPPSPVVSRIRPWVQTQAQMHSPGPSGLVGSRSGLLPSPILQRTRREREREAEAVLEEEEEGEGAEEDELLLKPGFNLWE